LPITAVALAVGWRALPSTRERPTRITTDWVGIAWLAVVVAASLATVAQLGSDWGIVGISLAVTIAAAAGYWRHAGRADTPVLRREHLTRFPLGFVHLSTGAILIAGLAADNYLPIYVHTVRERSIEFAAFSLVFLTVGWTLGAIAFSRVPTTWPETRTTLAGSTLMIPSLTLAWLSISGGWHLGVIFTAYALIGVSIGLVSTSGVTYMQRGAAEAEMGRVNSAHQFVRTLASPTPSPSAERSCSPPSTPAPATSKPCANSWQGRRPSPSTCRPAPSRRSPTAWPERSSWPSVCRSLRGWWCRGHTAGPSLLRPERHRET
jgi:hypothetical protein